MRIPFLIGLSWVALACAACAADESRSIYEVAARSRLQTLSTNQSNVQLLHSLTNLPASIREKLVPIADSGQPFSKGCTGSDPHRRFLVATRAEDTYNVAFEQGGFAYTWLIVQLVVDPTGKVIREAQIEPHVAPDAANQASPAAGSRR